MRVGIFVPEINIKSGGAHSFKNIIIKSLLNVESDHDFYIFHYGEIEIGKKENIKYVPIDLIKSKRNIFVKIISRIKKLILKVVRTERRKIITKLNKVALQNNIELMWFITPFYEDVEMPFVYTVWDLQHRLQPFFPEVSICGWDWISREKSYQSILPRATFVIAGTEECKREINQFYNVDESRIKVISLPAPNYAENYEKNKEKKDIIGEISTPFLFYPAQFWPHKNHVALLLALKILIDNYKLTFELVFVGSDMGNLKYVKLKTEELGLNNYVHYLGFVSNDDLISLYRSSFALVFPSFFGPDNLPPLEAMALSCPVIAANQPGIREQLGNAALLVDATKESEIAEAVIKLYRNENYRTDLVQRGLKRASSFTADDYVVNMIKIIEGFSGYRRCWSSKDLYIHL